MLPHTDVAERGVTAVFAASVSDPRLDGWEAQQLAPGLPSDQTGPSGRQSCIDICPEMDVAPMTKSEHCRAEGFRADFGWVPVAPARKCRFSGILRKWRREWDMYCDSDQGLSRSQFPLPTFAPTLSRLSRTNCTRRDLRNTRGPEPKSALGANPTLSPV